MTASNPLRLHWLDPRNPEEPFPPVENALTDPNGLLAIGGDLSVHRLLQAYRNGIFPWFNPDEPILWWAPNPRAVFRPDALRISRSLGRTVNRANYAVTLDSAFALVIQACSEQRRDGTWLGDQMKQAYMELFRRGYAHSVEVWRDGELIGGLYGVAIGRVFFGESMFSRANDGSKIALVWLSRQLAEWDFPLIDCQVGSSHLSSLGAELMPRNAFQRILSTHCTRPAAQAGSWHFDIAAPADRGHRHKSAAGINGA